MRRKRTIGNKVWIGLLGFSLLVFVLLDGLLVYATAVGWIPREQMWKGLVVGSSVTWITWRALQRRLSISGSDEFL